MVNVTVSPTLKSVPLTPKDAPGTMKTDDACKCGADGEYATVKLDVCAVVSACCVTLTALANTCSVAPDSGTGIGNDQADELEPGLATATRLVTAPLPQLLVATLYHGPDGPPD